MRSVDEHLEHILSLTPESSSKLVPVAEALGAVLAADVCAAVNVPVFTNSAMDGYAVHFADVQHATPENPVSLTVTADLPAGTSQHPVIERGQAARIMTGAPFPRGADTVVPVEETDAGESLVRIMGVKNKGAHIRMSGEDIRAGEILVSAGTRLGALELSAIASVGVSEVRVSVRPRVSVMSTGSELVEPGGRLEFGQIPESNSVLIATLAKEAGAEVVFRGTVNDEVESLLDSVDSLPEADVLILSGGVGAGAYDVVKTAFGPHGDIEFMTVAMQPGKPQGFGQLADGTLVFCLPGNPVSAAVSFETFVRPALNKMSGASEPAPQWAIAGADWRSKPGRVLTIPAVLESTPEGKLIAHPANVAPGMGSHRSATLAKVQAWVVIPPETDAVSIGDIVQIRRR